MRWGQQGQGRRRRLREAARRRNRKLSIAQSSKPPATRNSTGTCPALGRFKKRRPVHVDSATASSNRFSASHAWDPAKSVRREAQECTAPWEPLHRRASRDGAPACPSGRCNAEIRSKSSDLRRPRRGAQTCSPWLCASLGRNRACVAAGAGPACCDRHTSLPRAQAARLNRSCHGRGAVSFLSVLRTPVIRCASCLGRPFVGADLNSCARNREKRLHVESSSEESLSRQSRGKKGVAQHRAHGETTLRFLVDVEWPRLRACEHLRTIGVGDIMQLCDTGRRV